MPPDPGRNAMFEPLSLDDNEFGNALQSLRELESTVDESILQRRSSTRFEITTKLFVSAGNSSQRDELRIEGVTGDISSGGCLVVMASPILPGDVFWLDFTPGQLTALGGVFARCMRCRFIAESTFEVGFRFFTGVDIEYAMSE